MASFRCQGNRRQTQAHPVSFGLILCVHPQSDTPVDFPLLAKEPLFLVSSVSRHRNFVEEKLGVKYTEGRKTEFAKSFRECGPASPVFFILSPGVDPLKDVESLGNTYSGGHEY